MCQSETTVPQISSAVLSKWLDENALDLSKVITLDCKTADGDTFVQLVCQSQTCVSQISSAVLLKWLDENALDLSKVISPDWMTADGDALIQLVCQSQTRVSQISSVVLLKWLDETALDLSEVITPDWKTADGDTLLQLVCQSQTCVSQTSSVVLLKWLEETALNLSKVITPDWKTADGDTLVQLVCQSQTRVSQISSVVLLKWLDETALDLSKVNTPDWKTADDDALLQLILQSESSVSKIHSNVLSKWLSDGYCRGITVDRNLIVADPKWKTLDGDCFFHALCQSEIEDKKLIELLQHYIQKDSLNPDTIDSNGNTALHIACQADKPELALFLLNEAHCDPCKRNKMESLPLDLTTNPEIINSYISQCDEDAIHSKAFIGWMNNYISIDDKAILRILQSLVGHHIYKTQDGSTLLHLICSDVNGIFRDKKVLLHYLLTEGHCDPNCLDSKGQMPLQLTLDSRIMKSLIEHGAKMTADIVFKVIKHISDSRATELLNLSIRKGTMLWNPTDFNSDGDTAIHHAFKLDKPAIVNCLLTEIKLDPNASNHLEFLIEQTTNLEIAKMLIKHGARISPEMVLRLEAMEASEAKPELIKLMLTTWNPDGRDSDGYSALHLACKANNPTTVNLLLSVAHCDPNVKSNSEEVPLRMTTNADIINDLIRHGAKTSIMYKSYQKPLGTSKPVQPPVKVFIVGNPSVGKSTLTEALKKRIGIIARIFSGKVSGVDKNTVGIVPHDIESDIFGRITIYDFAGHREFYSGHAALLQTAIQSTPPVFLLVVNLCEDKDKVMKNILYWVAFLENQCASVNCKPHVILVGSHADAVKGVNPKDKVKMIADSLNTKYFTNMEYIGFIAMNCQYHESTGMSDLRRLLIKSCEELRIQDPITFNAHCFLVFLIETFMDLTAVTIKTVSENIDNQQSKEGVLEFLPKGIQALFKICLELNDRGHILLLKDRIAAENSCIVIDKDFLLSEISGTVFAPEGFRQHTQLSTNTGVVPRSKLADSFPGKDLNIVIGFLNHLEFCHEIADQALHELISEQYSQMQEGKEHYYLFPGLISVNAEGSIWETETHFENNFGWTLRCINDEQFFSSRFLQVLLLRLAFSFALKVFGSDCKFGIRRKCSIWKNGIFWGRNFNMDVLVEVTGSKSVNIMARFGMSNLLKCVEHRSKVLQTILECVKQFCPRLETVESFIDSSSALQYPFELNSNKTPCSVQDLCEALVSNCECPSVVLSVGKSVPVNMFITYEPYAEIEPLLLQKFWDKNNENKIISDNFLTGFVRKASSKLNWFANIFNDSANIPNSNDGLFHELIKWRGNKMTYKDFRQKMDQYSVFAGRNVLDLAEHDCETSTEEKEEMQYEKIIPRLRVEGNSPQLHELYLLTFDTGYELRIIEEVAPKWKEVAAAIGFNEARIKIIDEGEHYKPEKATFEMLSRWLNGEYHLKPVTWNTLIQCLKQANLPGIVELLSNIQIGTSRKEDMNNTTLQKQDKSLTNKAEVPTNTNREQLQMDHRSFHPILDMKALNVIDGRGGGKIRVIESIGSQWEEVAKALDIGQEDIDVIKTTYSENNEEACHAMLATWLESNINVSWTAFTQALFNAGLPELADNLDVLVL